MAVRGPEAVRWQWCGKDVVVCVRVRMCVCVCMCKCVCVLGRIHFDHTTIQFSQFGSPRFRSDLHV